MRRKASASSRSTPPPPEPRRRRSGRDSRKPTCRASGCRRRRTYIASRACRCWAPGRSICGAPASWPSPSSPSRSANVNSYREFWPYYVDQHRRLGTRRLHFVGTTAVIVCVLLAILLANPWYLLLGPVVAYGPAWIGHLFVERNRPATFRHPFW